MVMEGAPPVGSASVATTTTAQTKQRVPLGANNSLNKRRADPSEATTLVTTTTTRGALRLVSQSAVRSSNNNNKLLPTSCLSNSLFVSRANSSSQLQQSQKTTHRDPITSIKPAATTQVIGCRSVSHQQRKTLIAQSIRSRSTVSISSSSGSRATIKESSKQQGSRATSIRAPAHQRSLPSAPASSKSSSLALRRVPSVQVAKQVVAATSSSPLVSTGRQLRPPVASVAPRPRLGSILASSSERPPGNHSAASAEDTLSRGGSSGYKKKSPVGPSITNSRVRQGALYARRHQYQAAAATTSSSSVAAIITSQTSASPRIKQLQKKRNLSTSSNSSSTSHHQVASCTSVGAGKLKRVTTKAPSRFSLTSSSTSSSLQSVSSSTSTSTSSSSSSFEAASSAAVAVKRAKQAPEAGGTLSLVRRPSHSSFHRFRPLDHWSFDSLDDRQTAGSRTVRKEEDTDNSSTSIIVKNAIDPPAGGYLMFTCSERRSTTNTQQEQKPTVNSTRIATENNNNINQRRRPAPKPIARANVNKAPNTILANKNQDIATTKSDQVLVVSSDIIIDRPTTNCGNSPLSDTSIDHIQMTVLTPLDTNTNLSQQNSASTKNEASSSKMVILNSDTTQQATVTSKHPIVVAVAPTTKLPDIPIQTGSICDHYELEARPFARGKFAQVKRCISKITNQCFAAKCIKKRRRLVDIRHEILLEIEALKLSYHTNRIIKLYEVYETPSEMILVLELAMGGELQRVLDDEECFAEPLAKRMVKQILEGLIQLHDNNIAHLDIKPQNLLLTESYPKGDIKLCDFGISRRISADCEIREICGTPDYVAPEILSYDPISLATDMWSLGVLTYVLLSGYSPFGSDNKQQTFCNITQANLDFPSEIFDKISEDAIDFMRKLIIREPTDRLTSREARIHPWLSH